MRSGLIKHDKVKRDDGGIVEEDLRALAEDFYNDMEKYMEGKL